MAVFSAAIYSENKFIQILHRKVQKNKIGQNCHRQDRNLPLRLIIALKIKSTPKYLNPGLELTVIESVSKVIYLEPISKSSLSI